MLVIINLEFPACLNFPLGIHPDAKRAKGCLRKGLRRREKIVSTEGSDRV